MLRRIDVARQEASAYRGIVDDGLLDAMRSSADGLRGRRLLMLNSTAVGGGVAEILRSEVPLLNALGVNAEWQVMEAPPEFYEATKMIHNGLQGGRLEMTADQWALYESTNREAAREIRAGDWDFIFVHDPQPCALRAFVDDAPGTRWIWRCHSDSLRPTPSYPARLSPYLHRYDAAVFSLDEYVFPGLSMPTRSIAPAIDPLSEKNQPMSASAAAELVARFGLDPDRPFITQVSRFDAWKDPMGVVAAWRLARRRVPDLQLALVGQAADDDPECVSVLQQLGREPHPDLFVIANQATDRDVCAFQTAARLVLQKSLREGFGLTVAEALWAGTPVVGGNVGGIPLQIVDGWNGFLVASPLEASQRTVELVQDPERARTMGRNGRAHVREHFLLPRLVRDEMDLLRSLEGQARVASAGTEREGAHEHPS